MEPTVLVETSHALPVVSIAVAGKSGATDDPSGLEGLSRLTARLIRRTGAGLTTEALDERIDALGSAMSVDVGYSTATVNATVISRSLRPFEDLLVDVLGKPSLAAAELGKLKRETVAELVDARDHDRELGQRWFRERLFLGHAYARSAAGMPKSIEAMAESDVHARYRSLLSADNLVFAFAGDIEADDARRLAERLAKALPRGEVSRDTVPEPAARRGRHLAIVDKPERTQTQIFIGCLGTHPHDPDHVALHVGNTIFGGTFTARLMHEVRSKRGWSYGAYSNLPYDRHRRGFSMWTFPKASDGAACIALQLEMLERWVSQGVTDKELALAKRYLVRSHAFAVDTASKRVGQLLDEMVFDLPSRYHAEYLERVQSVTKDEVDAAIRQRITPEDLVITVVGTASTIESDVRAAIPRLEDTEIIPFDSEG
jgi:zinc protease